MPALRILVLLILVAMLAGCSNYKITPPVTANHAFCNIPKYELTLQHSPQRINDDLMTAMEENKGPVLYLSGGGQHGAFGAGFISQWADNNGAGLPEFSVVTGVSTGALLSLAAFTNTPQAAVDGYSITGENKVLNTYVKQENGKLSISDYLTTLKKGALADLDPFRLEVGRIINKYDLINKIADRERLKRKLYIAAVDVDTGHAVAFDMTQMARRAMDARTDAKRAFITDCMIDAVAASSSVPLAALPIFIDNRMYIDGGARFGMFSDRVGQAMQKYHDEMARSAKPDMDTRQVYLIINGDQLIKPKCGKSDSALCTATAPTGGLNGGHKEWSLLSLIARVVDILSDQVYNFSEYKIHEESEVAGYQFRSVKIDAGVGDHRFALDGQNKTCAEWRIEDKVLENPIQFHPRYMKCLIDYGKVTARRENW